MMEVSLRSATLFVFLFALLAVDVSSVLTYTPADISTKFLPNLKPELRDEFGAHSLKKREILRRFIGEHLLRADNAVPTAGARPAGMNADHLLLVEGFAGAGLCYDNHNVELGSAVFLYEGAVRENFVPMFHFNDFSFKNTVLNHLKAVLGQAHGIATRDATNPVTTLGSRSTFTPQPFAHQAHPNQGFFVSLMATERNKHIFAHVDPFFYFHSPFASVVSIFTDNPNARQRHLAMNLFTRIMVLDLYGAIILDGHDHVTGLENNNEELRRLATRGFGFGNVATFLDALHDQIHTSYPPAVAIPLAPDQRVYGANTLIAQLDFCHQNRARNGNIQNRAGNGNIPLRAGNMISKALTDLYVARVLASAVGLCAGRHTALLKGDAIMYWLTFFSTDAAHCVGYNAVQGNVALAIRQTHVYNSNMFRAGNVKPANNPFTAGNHDNFVEVDSNSNVKNPWTAKASRLRAHGRRSPLMAMKADVLRPAAAHDRSVSESLYTIQMDSVARSLARHMAVVLP